MFALIPAYPTTTRAHLDAAPTFADIATAFAALTPSAFIVRRPARSTSKTIDIVAFHALDVALASHLNGRVAIDARAVNTCKHSNVGIPLIARVDGWPHECFDCGNGMLVNLD